MESAFICVNQRPKTFWNHFKRKKVCFAIAPMCLDANWMELIHALMEGRDPVYTGVGLGYMLRGGSSASPTDYTVMQPPAGEDWMIDPPHVMVVVPWDLDPADYSTDPASGGPWIMWEGLPYEHLMVAVK